MSIFTSNEKRCVEAIMRMLEARENARRTEEAFPEISTHPHPVEYVCKIGGKQFAVEHTRLEAFESQISDGAKVVKFMSAICDEVTELLPRGHIYTLAFAIGALDGVKYSQHASIRRSLIKWILERAHDRGPANVRIRTATDRPNGVPFSVQFSAQAVPATPDYRFFLYSRLVPRGLEQSRQNAMKRSLSKKCPKLEGWSQSGATTVLILEDWDIALSNPRVNAKAFAALASGMSYIPDEVYCISTQLPNPWTVWTFRLGEHLVTGSDTESIECFAFDTNHL